MRPLRAVLGRALAWIRGSLSAEQRWTAGLALLLAVGVLMFGHPQLAVVRRSAPPIAAGAAATAPESGVPGPSPAAPGSARTTPVAGSSPVVDLVEEPTPAAVPGRLRVMAVVAPGGLPGRNDEAAARAFLAASTLDAEVVAVEPSEPGLCERIVATADVAVASVGLPDDLRRCLAGRGVIVVAFDGRGPLAGPTGGAIVSTRRGDIDGLSTAIAWGLASGALRGKVGLVAAASIKGEVEWASPAWRASGLDLVATAFVPDADPVPPSDDIRRLASAGVDVVLFAVPAATAGRWALQHSLFDPAVRYVVGDAFDALWDEVYPPVLDGALAHTSLRIPWFAREHGETGVQAQCRQRWEEQVVPPRLLSGGETVMVFAWCQHISLLEAVQAAGAVGGPLAALLALVQPSPLTSDLGPLPAARWGPRQDAVVAWRASCTCWRSVRGFADRDG